MNANITERLDALRRQMKANGIYATVIPQIDPHQSEYLADHWQARRYLSGFTGSAGDLVVTLDKALLCTDSRYFIQAARQARRLRHRADEGRPRRNTVYSAMAHRQRTLRTICRHRRHALLPHRLPQSRMQGSPRIRLRSSPTSTPSTPCAPTAPPCRRTRYSSTN